MLGSPGTGKSLAVGRVLSNTTGLCWVVSTTADRSILSQWSPFEIIYLRSPLADFGVLEDICADSLAAGKSLYFIVENLLNDEIISAMSLFCSRAVNLTFVVDEAHHLLNSEIVNSRNAKAVLRLYRGSRHIGVETITASQRLVDIPASVRIVFTDLFIFGLSSFRDLEILSSELPDKFLVGKIKTLSPLSYLYLDKIGGKHGLGAVPLPRKS